MSVEIYVGDNFSGTTYMFLNAWYFVVPSSDLSFSWVDVSGYSCVLRFEIGCSFF